VAIILKDVIAASPDVTVNADFTVEFTVERYPPGGAAPDTPIKLWCEAAYAVDPAHVTARLGAGEDRAQFTAPVKLTGQAGAARIRILASCDEVHSFLVNVS